MPILKKLLPHRDHEKNKNPKQKEYFRNLVITGVQNFDGLADGLQVLHRVELDVGLSELEERRKASQWRPGLSPTKS